MQRTEKYFESDAFRKTAAGVILAAEADAKTGGGRIALDGTVFYPEGGGQPADRGTLTLADGTVLHVTDVHETNGIIWHTVDALPETAQPGAAVTGTIDWEWRFDKMQQHTGEHILSGILHQMFGAENVGFHIGSDAVRMDTSVPISAEGLREAELAANRIIWENVPVLITKFGAEKISFSGIAGNMTSKIGIGDVVIGKTGESGLHGTTLMAPDLRGGAALVLAALAAGGKSWVEDTRHIDRGYAGLTETLAALGARIGREMTPAPGCVKKIPAKNQNRLAFGAKR